LSWPHDLGDPVLDPVFDRVFSAVFVQQLGIREGDTEVRTAWRDLRTAVSGKVGLLRLQLSNWQLEILNPIALDRYS
jgi:hypothetical protein